jgi:HlyD family secretion protein
MTPTKSSQPKSRIIWIVLILVILVAAGGFGYQYWNQKSSVQVKATQTSYTTKQVRTGNITLGASGTVSLVPSQETQLAFTVSGTVAKLNVTVGQKVKKDDILAQLDGLDQLQADIKTAEQNLASAQKDLETLKAQGPSNLANAQLKVIDAQNTMAKKETSVVQQDWQRCTDDTVLTLYKKYTKAVSQLEALGDGGGSADYYVNKILPQKKMVDQALGAYQACTKGYTPYQVASTQANLSIAEAALKQAQQDLDTLTKNNGIDPIQLATAQNAVDSAQQALQAANDNLAGATITAPFDGTILSLNGKAGDTITISGKASQVVFMTISDLNHPLLQFSIDQADLGLVAKGEAANVIFDSYSDRTFKGTVTRVDPAISTANSTTSVSGLIMLDLTQEKDVPVFPKSLTGSVNIIQSAAENILLVPVEAVHSASDGSYGVYVVGANDKPEWKSVQVGISDVASTEIKSGLTANDVVITSAVQ